MKSKNKINSMSITFFFYFLEPERFASLWEKSDGFILCEIERCNEDTLSKINYLFLNRFLTVF